MHPFATFVVRNYYKATGWNEDNLYSNFTRSSDALLDLSPPQGLNFSISKAPNGLFKTSYSMTALPSLHGSVGYIFSSCDLDIQSSSTVLFKDLLNRFKVYDRPARPPEKVEEWLAGKRVDTRDYLMYGRLYIPTGRLDALYISRISPTLQAMINGISDLKSRRTNFLSSQSSHHAADLNSVVLSLSQNAGKWSAEYSYSVEDGMAGFTFLHNFGKYGLETDEHRSTPQSMKRVDEDEAMEGGLKGRISAGAEVYFSAREKSGGASMGIRFSTLPEETSSGLPTSHPDSIEKISMSTGPPTTLTALFNPIMGHITGAYAARVSRDVSMATRFHFNIYSYESEWTMGVEWWLRRLRSFPFTNGMGVNQVLSMPTIESARDNLSEVQGVVKARMSTNTNVALMWEGRLKNILVSLGVVSDLTSTSKPIRTVGLELSYFSSE